MTHVMKGAASSSATMLKSEEKERRKRQRKDVKRYIKGYIEHPEQAEEVEAIRLASYALLAEEPWD